MNALSINPRFLADAAVMEQFYADIEQLGFDSAGTVYRGYSWEELNGGLRGVYGEFVKCARAHRVSPGVTVNPTRCLPVTLPLSEAQHDANGKPISFGDGEFAASFASALWLDHLKNVIGILAEEHRFYWIIIGEPVYYVDLPGRADRICEEFRSRYPDREYPQAVEETSDFLLLRKLQSDVLMDFCADLTSHAKSVGFQLVGVMPRTFLPDVEGDGRSSSGCDNGRLLTLPAVDFAAVRFRPISPTNPNPDPLEIAARAYAEVLANSARPLLSPTLQPMVRLPGIRTRNSIIIGKLHLGQSQPPRAESA